MFTDSMGGETALLNDEQATQAAIDEEFRRLEGAAPDDVVGWRMVRAHPMPSSFIGRLKSEGTSQFPTAKAMLGHICAASVHHRDLSGIATPCVRSTRSRFVLNITLPMGLREARSSVRSHSRFATQSSDQNEELWLPARHRSSPEFYLCGLLPQRAIPNARRLQRQSVESFPKTGREAQPPAKFQVEFVVCPAAEGRGPFESLPESAR
jgi:hypothetical protein